MANLPANISAPFFYNGYQQFIGKNIFTLSGKVSRGGAVGYSTMKAFDGSTYSNYVVPNGKTLVIVACMQVTDVASTDTASTIGFGDTAVNDSASSPTNAKENDQFFLTKGFGTLANVIPMLTKIPAGKYPFVYKQNTNPVVLYSTFWCFLE